MIAAGLLLVVIAVAVGAALFVLWKIKSRAAILPVTTTWIDEFSVERYRPMLRLLDDAELRLLRSQPGATPKLVARIRRERCRIVRGYLRSINADFTRVSFALKLLMTQASVDRPDLASLLIRTQASFAARMLLVRLQLILYSAGIGKVDARALLQAFERVRIELRTIVPQTLDSAT